MNDRTEPTLRVGVVDGGVAVTLAAGELEATFLPGTPRSAWRLLLPDRTHLELDGGLPTGTSADEPAETDPIGDRTH